MFTWSLGWAGSPARLAITSLAFMFEEVPEPVWNTSIGNWSSCSPAATSSPARAMRSATSASSSPSSAFTRAAAALMRPSQRTTGTGTRSPDTGKFSTALLVSDPHSSCWTATSSLSRRWSRLRLSTCVSILHTALHLHATGRILHEVRDRTCAFPAQHGRLRGFRVLIARRDGSHPDRPVVDSGRRRTAQADPLLLTLRSSGGGASGPAGAAQARVRPVRHGRRAELPPRRAARRGGGLPDPRLASSRCAR